MADRQFTLLEFHFHDGFQLGPRSLGPGDGTADDAIDESTTDAVEESNDSSGPSVLGPLLGLGALAGLAYAVRKLLAGVDAEGLDALDDIDADVEAATEELQAEAEDSVPIEITEPEEETGGIAGLVVVALLGLVVVAAVLRKLLGGSEEIVVEE